MKSELLQTCPKCDGEGKIPISDELRVVLAELKRRRGATSATIHEALDTNGDFGVTAFNNRLVALMELGYVSRRKAGKTWIYSAK